MASRPSSLPIGARRPRPPPPVAKALSAERIDALRAGAAASDTVVDDTPAVPGNLLPPYSASLHSWRIFNRAHWPGPAAPASDASHTEADASDSPGALASDTVVDASDTAGADASDTAGAAASDTVVDASDIAGADASDTAVVDASEDADSVAASSKSVGTAAQSSAAVPKKRPLLAAEAKSFNGVMVAADEELLELEFQQARGLLPPGRLAVRTPKRFAASHGNSISRPIAAPAPKPSPPKTAPPRHVVHAHPSFADVLVMQEDRAAEWRRRRAELLEEMREAESEQRREEARNL